MCANILDSEQRLAVYFPPDRSVIVEAPPGHGKTFVMARRIEHLIQSGYIKEPQKILGLTFTNAAAGEMQDDIKTQTKVENLDLIRVMTFHSLGYKILRAYGNLIGLNRDFKIVGEIDRDNIIKSIANRLKSKITEQQFSEWTREKFLKNHPDYKSSTNDAEMQLLYQEYIKELGCARLDYDHLLIGVVNLFKRYRNVLEIYRSTFRYILVDEFQDTNPLQFSVLLVLALGHDGEEISMKLPPAPVFILADEQQAIYRFQGATPENIILAKKTFQCTEITLATNHRSSNESILRITQKLRGIDVQPASSKVKLTVLPSPKEESLIISERIKSFQGNLHDICVIAQNEYRLIPIRKLLEELKTPYVFVPDFRSKSIQRKYENIFTAISLLPDQRSFHGKLATRIHDIYKSFGVEENQDEVLRALLTLAVTFDNRGERAIFSERARQFYNDIFLQIHWGNLLRKTVRNKIFLSTIHGVKGLQFPQVHLCGLSCFEHIHSSICYDQCSFGKNKLSLRDAIDDSAKTLYVGISRAQDELYLYSTEKNEYGKKRKIICILAPYSAFFDITGNAQFCGQ